MELEKVNDILLPDGKKYSGWGYYKEKKGILFSKKEFVPNGAGKKFYDGYYIQGNFVDGIVNGPAIVSHDFYMYTMQCKNQRGNGWGMCINSGLLSEFGYYENSQLKNDLSDLVQWYYAKMKESGRKENMLNVYSSKTTHEVSDLFIGFPGTAFQNGIALCFMGFHFVADGSVWVGTTDSLKFSGHLLHFCNDGKIECGLFENGTLLESMELQDIIDDYYGTHQYSEDDPFAFMLSARRKDSPRAKLREQFRNIPEIIPNHNYFT